MENATEAPKQDEAPQQNTETKPKPRAPDMRIYLLTNPDDKKSWREVGAIWKNDKGFNLRVDTSEYKLDKNSKLFAKEFKREKARDNGKEQAQENDRGE